LLNHRTWQLLVPLACAATAGCGPSWHFAYDEGLRQARSQERDLLVFYKDPLDVRSGQVGDALNAPPVRRLIEQKVLCVLVPSYAPNRSFVAQYGVHDTPALIVIHPDGTYHSFDGVHTPEEMQAFLASAVSPGRTPEVNPRLPAGQRFDYFNIYEQARETARRQNRRLFIIYKWWLDPQSTELIRRVSKPEVARYLAESVKCILDWDHIPNREHVRQYGVAGYPALIIVEPDGRSRILSGLPAVDRIIPFIVSAHGPSAQGGEDGGASPRIVWYSDPDAAGVVAQRTGRDLLFFFHSDVSAVSAAAARILDLPDLQPLLSTVVNCRLEWNNRPSRDLMARYGVPSAPACVLLRRDGSFAVLRGHVSVESVTALILGDSSSNSTPGG